MANYPKYRGKNSQGENIVVGTCHVYVEEWDLDLRGIHYIYKRNNFYIKFPSKKGLIEDRECLYLIFSFCSKENQQWFTKAIQQALKRFARTPDFDKTPPPIQE